MVALLTSPLAAPRSGSRRPRAASPTSSTPLPRPASDRWPSAHPAFAGRRVVTGYGTGRRRELPVLAPRSEEELAELVAGLDARAIPFAPLGAGLSFGAHALSLGVAISTERLRGCRVDPVRRRVRAGAGLPVGALLRRLLPHGLVGAVLPSCSAVTVGGAVATDTYSRMTAGLGREGRWVRALRLVTPRGEVRELRRDRDPALFFAVVGGLGLLGIVAEVEYEVLPVGAHPTFRSFAAGFDGVDGLEHLAPDARLAGLPEGAWPGSGAVVMQQGARRRTMLTRHRWEDTARRAPTLAHQDGPIRRAIDLALRAAPGLASRVWQLNHRPERPIHFWDDPGAATFFMDSHAATRSTAAKLGLPTGLIQQSFVIPARGRHPTDAVADFTERCLGRLAGVGLPAAMVDVGFLPPPEPFLLSGAHQGAAYVVSVAVQARRARRLLPPLFARLTRDCVRDHGGWLHLTKNLCCDDDELRRMYAAPLRRLAALKAELDPRGSLRTELGDRLLAPRG